MILKVKHKEQIISWWKPIVLTALITVAVSLAAWAWSNLMAASDRNANDAVWRAEVNNSLLYSRYQDTLQSRELKSIEMLVKEFMTEVREDRRQTIMINCLQTQQIETLAEKTNYKKEIDKIKEDYSKLNELLQSNKSRKSMIMPDTMFQDFSLPEDSVSEIIIPQYQLMFVPCSFGILCINP